MDVEDEFEHGWATRAAASEWSEADRSDAGPPDPTMERVRRLFLTLCHRPQEEWSSALARSGEDEAVIRLVGVLLAHGPGNEPADAAESPGQAVTDPQSGKTLAGWRLLEPLGEGGSGQVYLGERSRNEEMGAFKLLSTRHGRDAFARLDAERAALSRLDHPAAARLIEAGTVELDGETRCYVVTEFVAEAEPLFDAAMRDGLDLEARIALLVEIAEAVGHAHSRGVVHRDLKPGNILLDGEGRPRIVDFGIATVDHSRDGQHANSSSTERSDAGEVPNNARRRSGAAPERPSRGLDPEPLLGTLAYLAPEQIDARLGAITPATDVYALGVVAYRLLTGEAPYEVGDSMRSAAQAILHVPPVDPAVLRPRVPRAVAEAVLAALAKSPGERPPDASAFAAALRGETTPLQDMQKNRRRRSTRVGAAAAIGLLATVAGAIWIQSWATSPASRSSDGATPSAQGGLGSPGEDVMTKSLQAMVVGASAAMAALPSDGADLFVPSQYPTIQAAIDASVDGDVIRVFPGTYLPFAIEGKSITVVGEEKGVIIDAELQGRAVVVSSVPGPAGVGLRSLDIRGGRAAASGEAVVGGGILVTDSTVTLESVSIRDCELIRDGGSFYDESGGGGIATVNSTLAMIDCLVVGNSASSINTGNSYASALTLGGGLFAKQSEVTLTNCEFRENWTLATTTGTSWHGVRSVGGGIAVVGGVVDVLGGVVSQNEAKSKNETSSVAAAYASGGGVFVESATGAIRDARVEQNVAIVESVTSYSNTYNKALGGGFAIWDCIAFELEQCDVTDNLAASGLLAAGLMHGGGLWTRGGEVGVTDCVVQGNLVGLSKSMGSRQGGGLAVVQGGTLMVRSTAACGNNTDQIFFDDAELSTEASCVESDCSECEDCDSSGVADLIEILNGTLVDADGNNVPDICECAGDLNGNGSVDGADISVMLGFWGENPAPYPAADINADGIVNGSDLAEMLGNWGPCQ